MLFSIVFRSAATAALVTLGLWLFLTFLWPRAVAGAGGRDCPPDPRYMALGLPTPDTVDRSRRCRALSPSTLFGEVVLALLDPTHARARADLPESSCRAPFPARRCRCGESLMIAWPQIVGLVAATILLFVARLRRVSSARR